MAKNPFICCSHKWIKQKKKKKLFKYLRKQHPFSHCHKTIFRKKQQHRIWLFMTHWVFDIIIIFLLLHTWQKKFFFSPLWHHRHRHIFSRSMMAIMKNFLWFVCVRQLLGSYFYIYFIFNNLCNPKKIHGKDDSLPVEGRMYRSFSHPVRLCLCTGKIVENSCFVFVSAYRQRIFFCFSFYFWGKILHFLL